MYLEAILSKYVTFSSPYGGTQVDVLKHGAEIQEDCRHGLQSCRLEVADMLTLCARDDTHLFLSTL